MPNRYFRDIGGFVNSGNNTILALECRPRKRCVVAYMSGGSCQDINYITLDDCLYRVSTNTYEEFKPLSIIRQLKENKKNGKQVLPKNRWLLIRR